MSSETQTILNGCRKMVADSRDAVEKARENLEKAKDNLRAAMAALAEAEEQENGLLFHSAREASGNPGFLETSAGSEERPGG